MFLAARYFECRTTRNIWSGVAPSLRDDEDEAVLRDEDAEQLLRLSHVKHIPRLDHITIVGLVTSPVKWETAAAVFRHLKTHPLKVLERMRLSVIKKLCLQVFLSVIILAVLPYPLT